MAESADDESPRAFYDALAADYDALFDDWWAAAQRHAAIVDGMLQGRGLAPPARVLDCACGIGTQALGLAALGYDVTGTDLSAEAVDRARREATTHEVEAEFVVGDMRELDAVVPGTFDAVIAFDNALAPGVGVEQRRRADPYPPLRRARARGQLAHRRAHHPVPRAHSCLSPSPEASPEPS